MKKGYFILPIIMGAISSAQATTIYNSDGTRINLNGWIGFRLVDTSTKPTELQNHSSNVIFDIQHKLDKDTSVVGYFRLKVDKKDTSRIFNEYLYVGLSNKTFGTLTFGKQRTNGFSAVAGDYTWLTGHNNNVTEQGNSVIRYRSASLKGLVIGADYLFRDLKENNTGKLHGYDLYLAYNTKIGKELNIGARGAYSFDLNQIKKPRSTDYQQQRKKAWRVATTLGYQKLSLALNYGEIRILPDFGNKTEKHYIMIASKYRATDKSAIYAQYLKNSEKVEHKPTHSTHVYTLGGEYKLHKSVITWIEYARWLPPIAQPENRYGIGLRVYF